jgi:alcohol dehydrogenase class IV
VSDTPPTSVTTFAFPTTIRFGPGARRLVGPSLAERSVVRPLVVTDRGVAELDAHGELLDDLRAAGLTPASFSEVWGNPVVSQVATGVEAFAAHGADAIVGLGGGAALDVAKAVGLWATHPGDLFDYEDEVPGARPIEDRLPWFVAVPTTAGTGSEVGRSAVIADDATHVKRIVASPHLLAREVFADPELTVGLPPHLTAATGMDALTHNVEAYLSPHWHPMCDGIALEGVRLCARHLRAATTDGSDLAARSGMLMASMMGAVAFQKGLGVVHSCAHALGTAEGLHHGLANALMIDHALAFNATAAGERMARLAATVDANDRSAGGLLGWLADLKADLGIAAGLADHGLDPAGTDTLVALAVDDVCHQNNPVTVSAEDFAAIFRAAFA